MIEAVRIRNWQSLQHVDLTLGRYTVIVGASSSGKTALMRAFRALASCARGAGQITRGASTAAVTAFLDDGEVTLEYAAGSWKYRTVLLGHEESYTKLEGRVPAQISNILGLAPVPAGGVSINFAGQFDRPYLLSTDDSGAKVARVLGELTNVHVILGAVREANRRRTGLAATLKVREGDLAALVPQLGTFTDLPARLAAFSEAETLHEAVVVLGGTVQRLRAAVQGLEVAQGVVAGTVLPEVPDVTRLNAAYAALSGFRDLVESYQHAKTRQEDCAAAVQRHGDEETAAWEGLQVALQQSGECPTCGRTITDRIQTVTSTL